MFFVLLLTLNLCPAYTHAQENNPDAVTVEPMALLSPAELRDLVAPIALYPDDLLAIVLPASTYPLQVVAAARYRDNNATNAGVQPKDDWDESVVALLNYPEALALLNEDIDWTWSLGQAVLDQQADVLAAVEAFRNEAYAAGNLKSDEHQVVEHNNSSLIIRSKDPEVVYVPYYDPTHVVVYQSRPVYYYYPTPYPVYYYPYHGYHRAYKDHYFWGLNSVFTLSWTNHYIGHYHHKHRKHRYYGHRYHQRHFNRTRHYHNPRAYQQRVAYRSKLRHQRDLYAQGYWQPNHRYAGERQNYRQHSRLYERPRHNRKILRKHTIQGGSAVHRDIRRQQNSVARPIGQRGFANGTRDQHHPRANRYHRGDDQRFRQRKSERREARRERRAPGQRHLNTRRSISDMKQVQRSQARLRHNQRAAQPRQQRNIQSQRARQPQGVQRSETRLQQRARATTRRAAGQRQNRQTQRINPPRQRMNSVARGQRANPTPPAAQKRMLSNSKRQVRKSDSNARQHAPRHQRHQGQNSRKIRDHRNR